MVSKWQLKDHEAEKKLFNHRLVVAGVFIVVLFVALILKLVNLQIYQHEYFTARSDGNRLHSQYVPPARGLIFDRNGKLLAENQPIFNLTAVPEQIGNFDETLEILSGLIRLTDDDIEQFNSRLQRNRVPFSSVPLRYILDEEEKSKVAVNGHLLPGIAIEPQFVRSYPLASLTAHSVGYVSEINREELDNLSDAEKENYGGTNHRGKTGIERTYEDLLHGTVGYEIVEKNNRGQVMRRLDRTDPVAGKNITLYMDAQLQIAAENALGDFRGAIVALDPNTGGILAMVSKPAFDPNLFVTGISSKDYDILVKDEVNTPLFDRTTNPYPPGSTIKPFLGLAGLHHEHIDYDFMGIDTIHDFMAKFGFGNNFAVDIAYARTGVLPSREWKMASRGEPWYPGDTINSSIGQGYMWATPLQLATAASIIANEGKVVPPRMLKAVDGELFEPLIENPMPDVMVNDSDYWRYIENAMTMVVHRPFSDQFRDYGTAYESIAMADREMSYKMAGKSGSAQVVVAGPIAKQVIDTYLLDILKLDFFTVEDAPHSEKQVRASDE